MTESNNDSYPRPIMTNQSYYRIRPRTNPTRGKRTDLSEIYLLGVDQRKSEIQQIRESRLLSPPVLYQPTPTPDLYSIADETSSIFSYCSPTRLKQVRMSSTVLTIPKKHEKENILSKNFPKGSFERRQIAQDRRLKKQQQHNRTPDYDAEHWFQLRQSLAELKRLAATEEVLVDPTTSLFNCDGYSFDALKQAIHHQQIQEKFRSGC